MLATYLYYAEVYVNKSKFNKNSLFMQVVYDYLKKKVITRGNSNIIRDELHSEPNALRINDRDQTSRHSSP